MWLWCHLGLEEIHPSSGEMFLKKEAGLERAPIALQSPIFENWEDLERLVRGLKAPKEFLFVTISFPMSWLFTITAETRRVLVLFRNLHLRELKIKNFGGLPSR